MKEYVVYMYKNSVNGKMYIGKTNQGLEKRAGSNGSGYRHCKVFNKAIKKYGWENFIGTVLCSGLTKEEAAAKEIEMIAKYKTTNSKYGYNIRAGGEGFSSEESRILWADPAYRENIVAKNKILWEDEEYKARRTENMRTAWQDPDKRKRRSDMAKKRWANPDFHEKATNAVTKACAKSIMCVETGKIYNTVKEAALEMNAISSNASRAIQHGYKWAGFHWKYVDVL